MSPRFCLLCLLIGSLGISLRAEDEEADEEETTTAAEEGDGEGAETDKPDTADSATDQPPSSTEPTTKTTPEYSCVTTAVSYENVSFDYTWRIEGMSDYMTYIKQFNDVFEIKYEKFVAKPQSFPGEWSIILAKTDPNNPYWVLRLVYETTETKRVNFLCRLEVTAPVGATKVLPLKSSKLPGPGSGIPGSKVAKALEGSEPGPRTHTLVWSNFGTDLERILTNKWTKLKVDTIELVFHVQGFSEKRPASLPCPEDKKTAK